MPSRLPAPGGGPANRASRPHGRRANRPALVPDLPDDRGRAARAEQELPELQVDVLVAAAHEELDVFEDALHHVGGSQRLRLDSQAVPICKPKAK